MYVIYIYMYIYIYICALGSLNWHRISSEDHNQSEAPILTEKVSEGAQIAQPILITNKNSREVH